LKQTVFIQTGQSFDWFKRISQVPNWSDFWIFLYVLKSFFDRLIRLLDTLEWLC